MTTRVPSNIFVYEAGQSITLSGEIDMKLVESGRKLRVLVAEDDTETETTEMPYIVQVDLGDGEDNGLIGNSAFVSASRGFAMICTIFVLLGFW